MIKPPASLGNTWLGFLGNCLLLVLLLPLIALLFVIFLPWFAFDWLLRRARREPKPTIPVVLADESSNNDPSNEELANAYATKAKELVKGLTVKHDESLAKYTLSSPRLGKRTVKITYSEYDTALQIDDLNCYEWNTADANDIDLFFWIAISALRNGIYGTRTKLGRLVYWTRSDELGVWVKVQRADSSYDGIDFYKNPPEKAKSDLRRPSF